jgi:hypothetical protein
MRMTSHISDTVFESPLLPRKGAVRVPLRRILQRIGCPERVRPGTRTLRGLHDAVAAVAEHAKPTSEWRSYPVRAEDIEGGRVVVDGRIELRSTKLARVLGACSQVYVFVLTLGTRIDELIEEALHHRYHSGLLLDAAASVAAECEAERLTEVFRGTLGPGTALTLRYSPGYCDWPLREQGKLYALLPGRPAGTELSVDYLMAPRKSISGIVGVGAADAVEQLGCACHGCPRTECEDRRSA